MNNRDFTATTVSQLNSILEGQTIKRVEPDPAIGSNGFTIICEGESGADGIAVSFCNNSATGEYIFVG